MKTMPNHTPPAVPVQVTVAQRCNDTLRARLLDLARTLRQAYLQVFGIPDYERYAAHMAVHHPGEPLLSRRDFYAWSIDRKYGHSGPRCC